MSGAARRRLLLRGLAFSLASSGFAVSADQTAAAVPPEVKAALNAARLQGQGRLRFLGLRVYDASLWAATGQTVAAEFWSQPLALEIVYQRGLQGQQIAERSLQEMKRQGELDEAAAQRWLQAMQGLFPDVSAGTRITGVNLPRVGASFYVDGRLKGAVNEPEFARRFFGIWLSPQSSDLKLRAALLGLGPAPGQGQGQGQPPGQPAP